MGDLNVVSTFFTSKLSFPALGTIKMSKMPLPRRNLPRKRTIRYFPTKNIYPALSKSAVHIVIIPHSRRIYYVRQMAIIDDISLKSRGIILIIRIGMKLWTNSTLFSVQILPECGIILLLGGRKCINQNYCYNIERKSGE